MIFSLIFPVCFFALHIYALNSSVSWNATSTSTAQYPIDTVNATCGESVGFMCKADGVSPCCSQYGQCGGTSDFCGTGCQSEYGSCHAPNATLGNPACSWAGSGTSPRCDGRCGSDFNNAICNANASADAFQTYGVYAYGPCCSSGGFCGNTSAHCEVDQGCQSGCNGSSGSSSSSSAAPTTVTVVSTVAAASSTASSTGLAGHMIPVDSGGFLALIISLGGALLAL